MAVLCSDGSSANTGEPPDRASRSGRRRDGTFGGKLSSSGGSCRVALLALCALGAWLAISSSSALALTRRGHVFSFPISISGSATGIAVSEATGHVYVALNATGQPGCALGCVDELELAGQEGKLIRQIPEVPDPHAIAVDNAPGSPSFGDVYVAATTRKAAKEEEPEAKVVYKFRATGTEPIFKLKKFKVEPGEAEVFESIDNVAVGADGKVFVYTEEGVVARFNNAEKNKSVCTEKNTGLCSLESEFSTAAPGLAVDSHGKLYLGHVSETPIAEGVAGEPPVVGKCEVIEAECETLVPELDQEATTAVAVDSAGESLVDNVDMVEGKKVTSVVAFGPSEGTAAPQVIQRIEVPDFSEGNAIAVNSATGNVYVTGVGANVIDVFEPEPAGAPRVDSLAACITTRCSPKAALVALTAQIDPTGVDTHAYFEYGQESCASSTCTKTPELPGEDLGGGFGDQTLRAELPAELAPGVYHFRVVAENSQGSVTSVEQTFTVAQQLEGPPPLADGRAWEMVSPPNKDGLEPEPIIGPGGAIQASRDGTALTYVADGPIPAGVTPEGNRAPEPNQILAVRGSSQWSNQDIATANSNGIGANVGLPVEYQAFSPNLSLGLVQPFGGPARAVQWAQPPLSPAVSEHEQTAHKAGQTYQEKTIFLHANEAQAPESAEQESWQAAKKNGEIQLAAHEFGTLGFLPLVTEENAQGALGTFVSFEGEIAENSTTLTVKKSSGPPVLVGMEVQGEGLPTGTTITAKALVQPSSGSAWELSRSIPGALSEKMIGRTPFGGGNRSGLEALQATPDLSHVLFSAAKPAGGLYEWSAGGQLQLVNELETTATVTEKSNRIKSVANGAFFAPGEEVRGEGIPFPGTKLVKPTGLGEWEISAEAAEGTGTHENETIALNVRGAAPGRQPDMRNAISSDGSRVFWSTVEGEVAHLFVRDTHTNQTLQLDVPEEGAGAGPSDATFQTANVEGTKVFFTDSQRLTVDSKAVLGRSNKPDLFVAELSAPGSPLTAKVTDLTPEGVHGESGAVAALKAAGGVLGASEDGSSVYFVADAALVNGATAGNCEVEVNGPLPENHCTLYVRHFNEGEWEPAKPIAVLNNEDSPDWGSGGFPGDLGEVTSRVSPSGRFLAFMSREPLTEFDNIDANPEAKGERDEEVFLYDAANNTLVCASCNPTGARPAGVFDFGKEAEPGQAKEGIGLVVDRIGIWGRQNHKVDHWLAGNVPGWTSLSIERALYQARYLSEEGRLFFNSPDHLVPAATGVKEKVYEFEPGSVGHCAKNGGCIGLLSSPNSEAEETGEHESAFIEASESGNDVFFLTAVRLPAANGTSPDVDTNFDIYDARVCQQGPSSSCLGGPPLGSRGCEGEACKGSAPPPLSFEAPATMTVRASGNVAKIGTLPSKEAAKPTVKKPTRAQLLAKALKQCRTKFKAKSKKKQRVGCEKRARKKYGPKHAAKKASRARYRSKR